MKKFSGFTLIELMIAISILAIVLVVGVPNFRISIQNNRLTTNANGLMSAIMIARNEAIKRGVDVQVRSVSGNSNWTTGWAVVSDSNNDGAFSNTPDCLLNNDCEIYSGTGLTAGFTLNSVVNNVALFQFDPRGRLRNSVALLPDTLVMCDSRGFVPQARAIVIANTGRSRVVSATDAEADVNGNVTAANACP